MSINSRDLEVGSPPTDGISDLAFSPQADLFAVSSWDEQVRVYEVLPGGATQPKTSYAHRGPVFSVDWSKDGSKIVSGGADNAARLFDSATGQAVQIAQHSAPVKHVKFLDQPQPIVATGSWDKTIKYWDLRAQQPIGAVELPERCYALDTSGALLVAGTAERHVCIVDINNPNVIAKKRASPLKEQLRSIACFPDAKGYIMGSIEGRIAVQYVDEKDANSNKPFTFKCHRDDSKNPRKVFSVNQIKIHPVRPNNFASCGSDSMINFWDMDARQRVKPFPKMNDTVSCMAFNRNGTILAYAQSYDWSKGYKHATATNKIFLHAVKDEELRSRSGITKRR
ncbi:WD40 repeat-like protein [Fennellomyces sp. T-0311]|nr:WD40 repeat-like protein [Fennellomyces sp. T-0311]